MQQHVKYCLCWDSVQRTNKNSSLLHPQEDPFSHLTNFIQITNFGVTDLKDYTETRFWFVVLYVAHNLILKLSCTYTQNIFELREQFEIGSNLRFSPALAFFLWIYQTHQDFTESEWEKRLKFWKFIVNVTSLWSSGEGAKIHVFSFWKTKRVWKLCHKDKECINPLLLVHILNVHIILSISTDFLENTVMIYSWTKLPVTCWFCYRT